MKKVPPPDGRTMPVGSNNEIEEHDDELEQDEGDVLAEVLKRGAGAAQKSRRKHQRIGLPLDTPFRVRPNSLGVVRLHRLKEPPYGFVRIMPEVWALFDRPVPGYRLFLGTTLGGSWFLFPSAIEGYQSAVMAAELTAVARAAGQWTVVTAPVPGRREIVLCRDYGEPLFPDAPAKQLVAEAFEGRTVTDFDDPRIDALAGRYDASAE